MKERNPTETLVSRYIWEMANETGLTCPCSAGILRALTRLMWISVRGKEPVNVLALPTEEFSKMFAEPLLRAKFFQKLLGECWPRWIPEETRFREVIKADCSASSLAALLLWEAASRPPLSISPSNKWRGFSVSTSSNLFYQKHRRFECGEWGFSIFFFFNVKSSGGRKPFVRRICIAEELKDKDKL